MCCLTIWDGSFLNIHCLPKNMGKVQHFYTSLGFGICTATLSSRIRKILETSGSGHPCVVPLCSVKLCVVLVCILCTRGADLF